VIDISSERRSASLGIRDEDAHFARRQAFGLDDIDSPTHYVEHAAKTLFLVWVTLAEHKWVTLGEHRGKGRELCGE
jgi:hypothetical protein